MAPRKNAKGGGGHSSSSGSSSSNNSSGTSSPSTGSSGGSSSPGARKDTKHGGHKNGRKGGISGSSFFTWFMVIALLGVWTSVAVVWFDLVDYEEVLGKLGVYDADGDGDFDVDDAKVLLGLTKDGSNENIDSLEEVLNILAEESSDWFYGFLSFLYDIMTPFEMLEEEEEESETTDGVDEGPGGVAKRKTKAKGLKERSASEQAFPPEEAEPHHEPEEKAPGEPEIILEPQNSEAATEEGEEAIFQEMLTMEHDLQQEAEAFLEEPQPGDDDFHTVPENDERAEALESGTFHEASQDHLSQDYSSLDHHPLPDHPSQDDVSQDHPLQEDPSQDHHPLQEDPTQDHPLQDVPPQDDPSKDHVEMMYNQENSEMSPPPVEEQLDTPPAKKKKLKLLNKFDKTIKTELNAAEKLHKRGKIEEAVTAFEELVRKYPQSPRARFGKAQCEDSLAEKRRSNEILLKAIQTYQEVANLPDVPADLMKQSLKRRAERQQFLGHLRGSLLTLQKLVQLFPSDTSLKNDLGVGYLLMGDNASAKKVYEEVLRQTPNDGFAKVHYGFILKAQNKIAESIPYLKEGIESGDPGTDDGRFYFHLGDAMQRVGNKEAYKWYELGYKRGHFASVWQRSLYNVNGLKAQPWWTPMETGYTELVKGLVPILVTKNQLFQTMTLQSVYSSEMKGAAKIPGAKRRKACPYKAPVTSFGKSFHVFESLERNWKLIRDEGLQVMDKTKGLFLPEDENLREKGDWSQFTLWQQGRKNEDSCKGAPKTCALLERFSETTGCRRGQIKYSIMHPGTHVWPHTGPTNCRLRMHLGLVIPKEGCKIRCANETRTWEEGKVLIFDDSFEHEVWQDASSFRLIFIVDVWHPELTPQQRRSLPAI